LALAQIDVEGRRMKSILAVLVLLATAAGCGSTKPKRTAHVPQPYPIFVPQPYPTEEQKYLEGFMEGYRGVHPLDFHSRHDDIDPHSQGVRDGYAIGRRDEMQQR
jgi:hypothetical protein